jgi:hypothetical protein
MAWFTRFTRFGDVHFVFGQELGNTCGPSSALMCYTKIMKLSPGATMYGESHVMEKHYQKWYGKPYDGAKEGTWPEGLVYALNQMGCGRWRQDSYSPVQATAAIEKFVGVADSSFGPIVSATPIILGVNWDGSTASHWVCIDTVRDIFGRKYATICDPWDANVHVQRIKSGDPFVYEAKTESRVDLWGTHFEYSAPSKGVIRDWPIIHLES